MLLGQVVAISVASNLFYYAIASSIPAKTTTSKATTVAPVVWLSVLLSFGTIAYSPYSTDATFLPNLLVMHALLIVPLVFSPYPWRSWNMKLRTLYHTIAVASLVLHLKATVTAVTALSGHERTPSGIVHAITNTLYYHPAQSSIGWDIVWTSVSFVVWTVFVLTKKATPASQFDASVNANAKLSAVENPSVLRGIVGAVIAMAVGSVAYAAPVRSFAGTGTRGDIVEKTQ